MQNRRNYYRILHVQPDAPLALIRSSYRTLMQTLNMHPDLGGDHWNASLINEAYSVLKNSSKREQYDKEFKKPKGSTQPQTQSQQDLNYCPFCKTPYSGNQHIETIPHCIECQSPLKTQHKMDMETLLKRGEMRLLTDGWLRFCTYWPQAGFIGSLTDISANGLAFSADMLVFNNQIIKIESDKVNAILKVTHCQPCDKSRFKFNIGGEFIAVAFVQDKGTFVSVNV